MDSNDPLGVAGVIVAIKHQAPYGPIAMALFLVTTDVRSRPRQPAVLQPGLRAPTNGEPMTDVLIAVPDRPACCSPRTWPPQAGGPAPPAAPATPPDPAAAWGSSNVSTQTTATAPAGVGVSWPQAPRRVRGWLAPWVWLQQTAINAFGSVEQRVAAHLLDLASTQQRPEAGWWRACCGTCGWPGWWRPLRTAC